MLKAEQQWQTLIPVDALETGDVTPVRFGNLDLAVYDTRDGISVSMGRCTHGGARLCDGYLDGRYIECPLHQGLFDAITGEACAVPAKRLLKMFRARIRNGEVQILAPKR